MNRTQTFRGWTCLLSYLLVWIGSAQGLTLLAAMMDHTHQVLLAERHNQAHLIVHHAGNRYTHEEAVGNPLHDQADLPENVLAGAATENSNHEFHLSNHNQHAATLSKTIEPSKSIFHLATVPATPVLVTPVFNPSPSHLMFKESSTLVSLRTVVLLI